MQAQLTSVKNLKWGDAEHTFINCEITTSQYGNEILPFTASPNDCEAHGRAIFADIVNGAYGEIAEYSAPPLPSVDEQAELIRLKRNQLLEESDWSQAKDIPSSISFVWLEYRQLLRDVPSQSGFPFDIVWPSKP